MAYARKVSPCLSLTHCLLMWNSPHNSRGLEMKRISLLAVFVFTSLLIPSKVWPCEYRIFGDGGPRATNHRARAVFVGKVLGVERATPEQIENGLGVAVARFLVKRFCKRGKPTELN